MRFTHSRRLFLAASATALLTASAALSIAPARAADGLETKVIRYQSSTGADISPLELADALGYLAPITLERVGDVQGGPANLQAAATGQVDIASAFNGAVLNIVAAGAVLTVAARRRRSHS